jgi:hypothetical protein
LLNRKIVLFQGQIEAALKNFRATLELKIKEVVAVWRIKSHLTGAGMRKCHWFSPLHLLFVLTNPVFLHTQTIRDLVHRLREALFLAPKDTLYRLKKAEWSWGLFSGASFPLWVGGGTTPRAPVTTA